MSSPTLSKLATFATTMLALSACTQPTEIDTVESKEFTYAMPVYKDDGWPIGHAVDYGINPKKLTELVEIIKQDSFTPKNGNQRISPSIDSISIVKDGALILHQDFRKTLSEYDAWLDNQDLKLHLTHSTSKSFVSTLVGIALEKGFITGIDTPLLNYFDYSLDNWQFEKTQITIEHALTMQLGIQWNEWDYSFLEDTNSLTQITSNNRDYVEALFELPMDAKPGEQFAYNTVASIALGAALENAVGLPLETFAQQYLFEPLQIKNAKWLETPDGYLNTGSGLFLPTRDMAKLGQLYLDGGQWQGATILSKSWIEKSTSPHVELDWEYTTGYGYQWWLGEFELKNEKLSFYSARGYGGQLIIVIPSIEMVVAFTAHDYENNNPDLPFYLVKNYLLTAIESKD